MEEVIKTLAGIIAGMVSGILGYLKIESSRKKRNEEIDTRLDENRELKKEVETLKEVVQEQKEIVQEQKYILEQKSKEIELLFDKYDQTSKELRQLNENFIRFSTNIENMMKFMVPQFSTHQFTPNITPTCVAPVQK